MNEEKHIEVNRNVGMPLIRNNEYEAMIKETNDKLAKTIICMLDECNYKYLAWELVNLEVKLIRKKEKNDTYVSFYYPCNFVRKHARISKDSQTKNTGIVDPLVQQNTV